MSLGRIRASRASARTRAMADASQLPRRIIKVRVDARARARRDGRGDARGLGGEERRETLERRERPRGTLTDDDDDARAVRTLAQEAQRLQQEPIPGISVRVSESNLRHFTSSWTDPRARRHEGLASLTSSSSCPRITPWRRRSVSSGEDISLNTDENRAHLSGRVEG